MLEIYGSFNSATALRNAIRDLSNRDKQFFTKNKFMVPCMSDFIFFLHSYHKKEILKVVVEQLNYYRLLIHEKKTFFSTDSTFNPII